MALYYNVVGSTSVTTQLASPNSEIDVNVISICNIHASNNASITVFIQDDPTSGVTNTYKIINNVVLPAKTTLVLDDGDLFTYDNKYGLYITVGSSDTVDVIIK
tara:strand:+ start:45 stop:356 length:312 start_codon:yes stop_codon:yes gene_type:complete